MPAEHPATAFHFRVRLAGEDEALFSCSEVSGLEHKIDTEPVIETGDNRFVHQLPKPVKHGNLSLKRGVSPMGSDLVAWCKSTLEGDYSKRIEPKNIEIVLYGEERDPLAVWQVSDAYPVKWSVGAIDAMKDELAVEEIELAFASLTRSV